MDGNGRWATEQGLSRSAGHKVPDVDLVIRTGGDYRISNFLLWQSAFAKLFIVDNYWPTISRGDIEDSIKFFNRTT